MDKTATKKPSALDHDAEALALLRHELATMPLEKLRKGYRDAIWRFAMSGSPSQTRAAHATAVEYAEAYQRRTGAEVR